MKYWLMKSEPDTFGIDHLEKVGTEPWSGVRNFTARNFMKDQMEVGDTVLFYHSSCAVPGVYGLARVASKAYPDKTQFDPTSDYYDPRATEENPLWFNVDVQFVRKLPTPYTLAMMRANKELVEMTVLERGNRLSITPVTEQEYHQIVPE